MWAERTIVEYLTYWCIT